VEDRELSRLTAICAVGALVLLAPTARAEPAAEAPVPAEASDAAPAPAADATAPATAGEAAASPAIDLHRLHQEAAESFYTWDGDRDGSVAAPEAMEMTPEAFAAADRDRDGKLSLLEWVDARFAGTAAAR
jgi:hypothetical protein